MKKYWIRIGLLLLTLWLGGCIDDKGNYDYLEPEDVMPVKINGLEEDYYFTLWEKRVLQPEVTGITQEEDYQYLWYLTSKSSGSVKFDTISHDKNLDWQVTCNSGDYLLVFEVKDKHSGVFANKEMSLKVASSLAHGWYVMKDENGKTDVDLVLPDGRVEKDLLINRLGTKLDGTAVGMCYISYNYYHEIQNPNGTVTQLRTKALIMLSSKDMKIVNADNFSLFKNWEDAFYEVPEVKQPQWCNNSIFLLNGGKLHSIYTASQNVGKFGMAWSGDYDFYPAAFAGNQFFDLNSRSFFAAGSSFNTAPVAVAEPSSSSPVSISANKMNMDIVAGASRYALLKSIAPDGKYYLAGISSSGNGTYPFTSWNEVPAGSKLLESAVLGSHNTVSCVYFGRDNELCGHTVADVAEREYKLHTFPVGEKVSYIQHVVSRNDLDKFSRLVVLTNSTSGWKMYLFDFDGDTSEILPEPVREPASGEGTARYVMFRLG